jgi:curved DNA-binding protein CbpA
MQGGASREAPSVNLYAVLEVERTATTDEVKRAYRRLALLHHPDKNNGDDEKVCVWKIRWVGRVTAASR